MRFLPLPQKQTRSSIIILLALIVILLTLSQAPFPGQRLGIDAGVYQYGGWRVLEGELPYRDFWDHKPPAIFYIMAAGLWLSGGSAWGPWLLDAAALLIAALAGFFALKQTFYSLILAGLATAGWLGSAYFLGLPNRPELYVLTLQFLTIWIVARHDGAPPLQGALTLGLLGGLALMLKPNTIALWLALLIYWGWRGVRGRREGDWWKSILMMSVGTLIFPLLFAGLLWGEGGWADFWDAVIQFNLVYGRVPLSDRLMSLYTGFSTTAVTGLSFLAAAGWLLAVLKVGTSKLDADLPFLMVLALIDLPLELLAIILPGRGFLHYFIPWLPGLAILSAYVLQEWLGATSGRPRRLLALALLGAISLAPLIRWGSQVGQLARPGNSDSEWTSLRETAEFIITETAPTDNLLVWGHETRLNAMTRRTAPTRFSYQTPLLFSGYARPERSQLFFDEVRQRPPTLIIDTWGTGESLPADFAARQNSLWENSSAVINRPMIDFFEWVSENYHFERLSGPDGLAVYRLNEK